MKKNCLLIGLTLIFLAVSLWGTHISFASQVLTNPKFIQFTGNGKLLAGGKVYTYEIGSTTPKTTYSDPSLTTAISNPIILNSRGECSSQIYFAGSIKVMLYDSKDVLIWTVDNYKGFGSSVLEFETVGTAAAGGYYANIKAALAAGATNIYLVSDVSLVDNIEVPDGTVININGKVITLGEYNLNFDTGSSLGPPMAKWQIFDQDSTGEVSFDSTALKIYTAWWGDGTDVLADAINSISSGIIVVSEDIDIGSDITVPTGISIEMPGTGTIGGAYSLDFATGSGFIAGEYQAFDSDLTVEGISEVIPQWWGALGDGSTEDTTAIQAAINCAAESGGTGESEGGPSGGTVYFPRGIYLTDSLDLKYSVSLRGPDKYNGVATRLGARLEAIPNMTGNGVVCVEGTGGPYKRSGAIGPGDVYVQSSIIKDLSIDADHENQPEGTNKDCIYINQIWYLKIENCALTNATGYSIRSLDCNEMLIKDNHTNRPMYFERLGDTRIIANEIYGGFCTLWLSGGKKNIITNNFISHSGTPSAQDTERDSQQFTANASTDIITTAAAHGWSDLTPVTFSLGTMPTGIDEGKTYYIGVESTTSFKIYETRLDYSTDTEVNFTDAGSGYLLVGRGRLCNLLHNQVAGDSVEGLYTISNNRIDHAYQKGIVLDQVTRNTLTGNFFTVGGYNNTVGLVNYDLWLTDGAINNTIVGNVLDGTDGGDNTYGIVLDSTSTNNNIYPNISKYHDIDDITINDEKRGITSYYYSASDFTPFAFNTSSTPTLSTVNSQATAKVAIKFNDTEDLYAQRCCMFDPGLSRVINVTLYWVNDTSGTGDVVWEARIKNFEEGEVTNAVAGALSIKTATVTNGTRYALMKTTILFDKEYPHDEVIFLTIGRLGEDAADDLAEDVGLVGVRVDLNMGID